MSPPAELILMSLLPSQPTGGGGGWKYFMKPIITHNNFILETLLKLKLTRLGVDRVKPWNSVRINFGLDPDIRPGLDNRHLVMEGQGRSWMVLLHHWIDI